MDGSTLPSGMTPRLLVRQAAAAYLGMSAEHFNKHVSPAVPGLDFGGKTLWDVRALDRWIDEQSGLVHTPGLKHKLLDGLNGDSNEGR